MFALNKPISAQPVHAIAMQRLASAVVILTSLWGPFWWRMREAWGADPELMHGVAVPFLAGYLAWQRWRVMEVEPAAEGRRSLGGGVLALGLVGGWICTPVLEINVLWPRAQWASASFATMGTMGFLYWGGGWSRVRHFAFPVLFLLTALSWPSMVREAVVATLTQSHAEFAAELVSLLGYPALVRGNVIEVASGLIGVEEACAGLRSLQSVWMFALFFGELHRLSVWGRLRILLVAGLAAMTGNIARTLFLTWRIGMEGDAAHEIWHDEAGMAVLLVTLVISLAYAQWEAGRSAPEPVARSRAMTGSWPVLWTPALVALGLEVMIVEVAVWHWYERGQEAVVTKRWEFADRPGEWEEHAIPAATTDTLLCTSAMEVRSSARSRTTALAAIFRWENDQVAASSLTNAHDPSVCMPAIGGVMLGPPGETRLWIGSRELIFDVYRFEMNGRVQTVFNAVWDAVRWKSMPRSERGVTMGDERMVRVRTGQRYADRDRVVLVLEGDYSVPAAVSWLEREAPRLLQPTVQNQSRSQG